MSIMHFLQFPLQNTRLFIKEEKRREEKTRRHQQNDRKCRSTDNKSIYETCSPYPFLVVISDLLDTAFTNVNKLL
jgi:hypothetical protein